MSRVLLFGLAALLLAQVFCEEQAYEDVDVEEFFGDDEKRQEFFDCMLGVVDPCSEKNEILKAVVAEAVATDCEKCTDKQKETFKESMEIMQTKYEDQFKAMMARLAALEPKQEE